MAIDANTPRPPNADSSEKLWGGRFAGQPAALFERLNASLPFDHILAPYDIEGSRAHVRMLTSIGVLGVDDESALLSGLDRVAEEVESGSFAWDIADEDVHMAVERRLIALVGPVGGKVHTARSRNDQVALDIQLYLRNAVSGHLSRIATLMRVLYVRAEADQSVIMPGFTHLQRAQPVLLSHHLLAYFFMLERDYRRLLRWRESSWMPLGAGALAGVNYSLNREKVAKDLGFERVAPNAMDAVASRDAVLEYLSAATICSVTLSRLAEEIVLWCSQEFGLATLPDQWTSGSCIMPQKRNPDGAELVRAKTAGFLGRLMGLGSLLKGLPLAYNKDLQEDKVYAFSTRDELDLCLEAMAAMITVLRFDSVKARRSAEGGYAQATDVADYLVSRGMAFRDAHRVTGRLVAKLAEQGRTMGEARAEELQELSELFDSRYFDVVDLDRVIEAKISPGGTSHRMVAEQLSLAAMILASVEAC
jgi:argininosuccinate lyase